ncbi:UNVERIFIED_ORG: hypothetical protein GGE11_001448 [Mycolicibacterium obuense]
MLQRADDTPTCAARQIRAVGTLPDTETLFVGALLWSLPADAASVLDLVTDEDISSPALRTLVTVAREMVGAARPYTPAAVLDQLERRNGPRLAVRKALNDCLTSGAACSPEALRDYAAATVSSALRRCIESGGYALQRAAERAAEGELTAIAAGLASTAQGIATRLETLRGEEL